jgi:hypothetical protein
MATYKHESGEVVHLVDGGFEDTRIGSLALDGKGGWTKVEDDEVQAEQAGDRPSTPAPAPTAKAAPKLKPEG